MTRDTTTSEIELTIGAPAHGGHFVARHEGRVVFVRHALPGERVRARLTEDGDNAKFWRADVTEVLEAVPGRVEHFWPEADALRAAARGRQPVGGAEFGHIDLPTQRSLKGRIFSEQLQRLAKVERDITVEPAVEETPDGLNWRTRASFSVAPGGRLAMHAHRSDEMIPVQEMPLAVAEINNLRLWETDFSGVSRVEVAVPSSGAPLVLLVPAEGAHPKALGRIASALPEGISIASWEPETHTLTRLRGRTWVQENVLGHDFRVTGAGFWQIHRRAPQTLTAAVLDGLQVAPGETVADLYAGAGLFTAPLADAVGETGRVLSVEGSPAASRDARKNLFSAPQVEILQGRVDKALPAYEGKLDVVLLDPPRVGAGKMVVEQIDAANPRAVGYVSCDPASFARDLGYFQDLGWQLSSLRVFDLYPHTHHMESVAVLTRA